MVAKLRTSAYLPSASPSGRLPAERPLDDEIAFGCARDDEIALSHDHRITFCLLDILSLVDLFDGKV